MTLEWFFTLSPKQLIYDVQNLLQLYLWQLKDEDLVGIAFIDTQIYIHQMISVKNLIYIADFYKSVSLLRFQETHRTLAVVSRVSVSSKSVPL